MTRRIRSAFSMMILGGALLVAAGYSMAQDAVDPIPMGISSPAATGEPAPADAPAAVTDPAAAPAETPAAQTPEQAAAAVAVGEEAINPNDIPSVLFTYWEHTAITDAKRAVGSTREVTQEEWQNIKDEPLGVKPPPEERDITLGGIVYVTTADWTIWLNGKRVTPKAIPREVTDLKVYKEYIEMKWYDDYTNQIFPLRMRAHQRFNIDTRIFLPG
ncbi:MAG TPA: hypothetical protein PKX38_07770 [Alphaproteobacteria bacterium]|nr:hypothetical protein [Micavibrio sp.]MBK9563621.1 hypothetical protein [Micavibrio sp.]HQX27818.1 hypothetical protein [Alphaproteobacteria bacterium]